MLQTYTKKLTSQNIQLRRAIEDFARLITSIDGRAYVVGGLVRDVLLETPSHDADIEVYGVPPAKLEAFVKEKYPDQVIMVGRAFGILKIRVGEHELDIALPRRESKVGSGHKGFVTESDPELDMREAARRRDFTINALMADPLSGEVFDFFGGIDDLEKKILRVVDPKTFQDDPLRVYRALQFAARLELTIEQKSFELMHEMVKRGDLMELSRERVTDELRKLFVKAVRPSVGLELAWQLGIIEREYPELHALRATPQEVEWHPEGDVWIHTLMVVDAATKIAAQSELRFSDNEKLQIVLGALCHDLGKPPTTEFLNGRIRSRGHEEAGEIPARSLMSKWTFGDEVLHAVIMIVRDHLKAGMLYVAHHKGEMTDEQYRNAVRKLLRRIAPMPWRVFLAAAEADWRGRDLPEVIGPFVYGEAFIQAVKELEAQQELQPLLQGRDLLELGVEPGPEMGRLLGEVEAARDKGEIKTKEEALEFLKLRLKRR